MTLSSMTGFARSSDAGFGLRWTWELRSVNSRGLDVRMRLPNGFEALEADCRKLLGEVGVKRGSLNMSLQIERDTAATGLVVDEARLQQLIALSKKLAAEHGLEAPRVESLLGLRGVLDTLQDMSKEEASAQQEAVLKTFAAAAADLVAARSREGAKLGEHLDQHLTDIENLVRRAVLLAVDQPTALKQKVDRLFSELLSDKELDPQRLAQEAATLAIKADVREELDRLQAHISEARDLIGEGGEVGRKLDFLAQEFSREVNTLCSKSSDLELTRIGLDLKTVVDRLREQSANVA